MCRGIVGRLHSDVRVGAAVIVSVVGLIVFFRRRLGQFVLTVLVVIVVLFTSTHLLGIGDSISAHLFTTENSRAQAWHRLWTEFLAHPLFGVGNETAAGDSLPVGPGPVRHHGLHPLLHRDLAGAERLVPHRLAAAPLREARDSGRYRCRDAGRNPDLGRFRQPPHGHSVTGGVSHLPFSVYLFLSARSGSFHRGANGLLRWVSVRRRSLRRGCCRWPV